MEKELLRIETYNDGVNTVNVVFRKLHVDYTDPARPFISVICEELHAGAAGNFTLPLSLNASNDYFAPVYTMTETELVPVMVEQTPGLAEGDEGYLPPLQKTIGEFDMWRKLLFENSTAPLNAVIEKAIKIKKGLVTEPFIFIEG